MEDAMLERFTRERQQRANKTSMFNLDDAEEEGLTHYGRSLNDLDEYDDIHLSDEESEYLFSFCLNAFPKMNRAFTEHEYLEARSQSA